MTALSFYLKGGSFEAEIDRLVYALYGLTDEEIALVEGTA